MPKIPQTPVMSKKVAAKKAIAKKAAVKKVATAKLLHEWRAETVEARLCRLADSYGITPEAMAQRPQLVASGRIDPKRITKSVIDAASRLDRKWTEHLRNKAISLGGSWK